MKTHLSPAYPRESSTPRAEWLQQPHAMRTETDVSRARLALQPPPLLPLPPPLRPPSPVLRTAAALPIAMRTAVRWRSARSARTASWCSLRPTRNIERIDKSQSQGHRATRAGGERNERFKDLCLLLLVISLCQSHLRRKRKESAEQENMSEEQRAEYRAAAPTSRDRRGAGAGAGAGAAAAGRSKPLTRQQLADMIDNNTDDEAEPAATQAQVRVSSDKPLRRATGSGTSLNTLLVASASPPSPNALKREKRTTRKISEEDGDASGEDNGEEEQEKEGSANGEQSDGDGDDEAEEKKGNGSSAVFSQFQSSNTAGAVGGGAVWLTLTLLRYDFSLVACQGQCPHCHLDRYSRTSYYTHLRGCPKKPVAAASAAAAAEAEAEAAMDDAAVSGGDEVPDELGDADMATTMEDSPSKPRMQRQSSAEKKKRKAPSEPVAKPPMVRAQTEPTASSAAAAQGAARFTTDALTCELCKETFTRQCTTSTCYLCAQEASRISLIECVSLACCLCLASQTRSPRIAMPMCIHLPAGRARDCAALIARLTSCFLKDSTSVSQQATNVRGRGPSKRTSDRS